MLAVIAAVIFGINILLDFFNTHRSDIDSWDPLIGAGLFCLALHFAGVGTTTRIRSRRR